MEYKLNVMKKHVFFALYKSLLHGNAYISVMSMVLRAALLTVIHFEISVENRRKVWHLLQ